MASINIMQDSYMDIDTLKADLQHIFKELIGASLMSPREGKNSTHYAQLFESIRNALEDYEQLKNQNDEPAYEEPISKYPANSFKVIENSSSDQNRNLKFIAEELLIKVEHLLQKVGEKEHGQRIPRER